jgi:hypothetical protein
VTRGACGKLSRTNEAKVGAGMKPPASLIRLEPRPVVDAVAAASAAIKAIGVGSTPKRIRGIVGIPWRGVVGRITNREVIGWRNEFLVRRSCARNAATPDARIRAALLTARMRRAIWPSRDWQHGLRLRIDRHSVLPFVSG